MISTFNTYGSGLGQEGRTAHSIPREWVRIARPISALNTHGSGLGLYCGVRVEHYTQYLWEWVRVIVSGLITHWEWVRARGSNSTLNT